MKVSIIVATYGTEEWELLGSDGPALDSAMRQRPLEAFAYHGDDLTLAQVRNEAASSAKGDWLCFLDADDRLAPHYLAAMFRARVQQQDRQTCKACEPEQALLVPAVSYEDNGKVTDPAIPAWGRPLRDINCAVIGTLIHRNVFRAVGGFRELPLYEDYDLWARAVRYGCSLVPVPDAVYLAAVSPNGRNLAPAVAERRRVHAQILRDLGVGPGGRIEDPGPLPLGEARLPPAPA